MVLCTTYRVEQGDADVLDDAVQGHELEDAEGRDESSTALPGNQSEGCRLDQEVLSCLQ